MSSYVSTIGSHTNITLTRGDSFYAVVSIVRDGEAYVPDEGDVITFAAEDEDGETVLAKTIPLDTLLLSIYPEETKALPVGSYRYNIRLTSAAGTVDTFVRGKLLLEREVE